jgi:hypothetical protein
MRLRRRTTEPPATAGRVGCHTCGTTADVPAATAGAMLWEFFAAHPNHRTWVDVAGLVPKQREGQ